MDNAPILAFGLPRSGTTWIGKLFDSHPDVAYRHEPDSWVHLEGVPLFPEAGDPRWRSAADAYLDRLPALCSTATCGKLPIFPKRCRSPLVQRLHRWSLLLALMSEKSGIGPGLPVVGGDRLLPSARLVWKSIESLGRMGLFLASERRPFGIHIVRHPCGYISSVIRGEAQRKFRDNNPSSDDWGIFEKLLETETARSHALTMEGLRALTPVERLAWRWLLYNEHTHRQNRGNPRYRLLLYEAVCDAPLETMKEVFAFCELPWDRQTEEFIGRSSSRHGRDSYYSIYKNPKEASARWQKELDGEQIAMIRDIVERGETGRMYGDRW